MGKALAWSSTALILVAIAGCGQDKYDDCVDRQAGLWNTDKKDNSYKGNEAYWNAVSACEDKHGK